MLTLEKIDQTVVRNLAHQIEAEGRNQVEVQFNDPAALSEEFKAALLTVLARRKKENLRAGRILTISHPGMDADEQIPYLAERSEIPAVTIRRSTPDDLRNMHSLGHAFPVLMDAHNAIGSSRGRRPQPAFLFHD